MSEDMSEEQAQVWMGRQRELMVSMWCSALFSVLMGLEVALNEWEQWEGPGKAIPGLWKIVSDNVASLEESEKRRMAGTLGNVASYVAATYPGDRK